MGNCLNNCLSAKMACPDKLLDAANADKTMIITVHKVFAQPLLLEKILDYAIRQAQSSKLWTTNIKNIRLVCKNWKSAVTAVLCHNLEPLYNLNLREYNSPFVTQNGKLLTQFVDYWTTGTRASEIMPTFRLKIEQDFFQQENYSSLLDCFMKCKASLVVLEMNIPENLGSFPGILPKVNFLALQKLTIRFTGQSLEIGEEIEQELDNACNVTFLFQSLLSRNKSLKQLTLTCAQWNHFHTFPGVQYISLPDTLTHIAIHFPGRTNVFQLLTNNTLPNLRELALSACCSTRYPVGLLFRIFENVCKSLRVLRITGRNYYIPRPRATNLLYFPVMEKLHTLEISRAHFELEIACVPSLETFPKLKRLELFDQTPTMLQKWMTGQAMNSVKAFTLEMIDEGEPGTPNHVLPLSLKAIQNVNCRFPYVSILDLTFSGPEMSGLLYIFKEMRQLFGLRITVMGSQCFPSNIDWDSLLIGAPKELVTGMCTRPQFWNKFGLRFTHSQQPSIRMLKNLYFLSLTAHVDGEDQDDIANRPIISDLAFIYGFLMLRDLKRLNLKGRFAASRNMAIQWREKGRHIE